ncbi:hypothetical protein [Paraburkholderia saeva]|uniref:Uncharacterized protein n=1 Tax=Paraburkholderia saeva TaxID=2777537 RepID=A0A9N8S2E8_9BURK|nr:hypothetical protein [Paraburkholderia saeva]CAG4928338.1 hypothetical protein LMG31841_05809 [Paraburkholderia saeva]
MQPWDSAFIKLDSKHPDAGRAGLVQAVDKDAQSVSLRLDADGVNPVKFATAHFDDVTRLG